MPETPVCIVESKNILGECPVWDAQGQALYWVDITGKILHRFAPNVQKLETWALPCEFSSFSLRSVGPGIVAGTRDGFCIFDCETGAYELFSKPEASTPQTRMNDGKCDPRGRFWCGSIHEVSDPSLRMPIASVYRVDADRRVSKVFEGIKTSNGFAWSPDGGTMYFTDTPTLTIMAYDYDLDVGAATNPRVFSRVLPGQGRPDGAAVDVEGCLWSAHFAGARLTRYAPTGEVLKVIELPVANVTSCAFGGIDMSTLFITTAREDMTEDQLEAQPLAGGVFAYDAGVQGIPVARYAG